MTQAFQTVALLIASNVFMTLAWYAHLKMAEYPWFQKWPIIAVIVFSWGIAFFEYCLQVPANRIGFEGTGAQSDARSDHDDRVYSVFDYRLPHALAVEPRSCCGVFGSGGVFRF